MEIEAAKIALSELLARVESGEEIVIAIGNRPLAKLVPCRESQLTQQFGALKRQGSIGPEFFEALTEDELALWQ